MKTRNSISWFALCALALSTVPASAQPAPPPTPRKPAAPAAAVTKGALEKEPPETSLYQITALLAEAMGLPVDIILLSECRFRECIASEGEIWMLAA